MKRSEEEKGEEGGNKSGKESEDEAKKGTGKIGKEKHNNNKTTTKKEIKQFAKLDVEKKKMKRKEDGN